jgi:hypothetical protein
MEFVRKSVMKVAFFWDIALTLAAFLCGRFSTLKMEVICSSETSVHIRTRRRYIPEDIIHNYL